MRYVQVNNKILHNDAYTMVHHFASFNQPWASYITLQRLRQLAYEVLY